MSNRKKRLETTEWMFLIKALEMLTISGKDVRKFIEILDKVEHQTELSMARDNKLADEK
tara:strand:+ start:333 stop:509 length:177 start_codon:yes stop_codon:yes gene_type:complete